MIPAEAVEAAAKAEYEHQFLMLEGTWAEATREVQALFKQSAKVALEAAAPHMLAEAWDDGHAEGVDYAEGMGRGSNPYRPTQ